MTAETEVGEEGWERNFFFCDFHSLQLSLQSSLRTCLSCFCFEFLFAILRIALDLRPEECL